MRKRLIKKMHKRYLEDIVYEVSVSPVWRKTLYSNNQQVCVINQHIIDLPEYLKKQVITYQLKYYVSVVSHDEAKGWEDWDATQIYFKFEAAEFPEIQAFSANNPEVI